MAPRKVSHSPWLVPVIIFLGGLVVTTGVTMFGFYYNTNAVLSKHDEQFRKLGDDFKAFGETSKQNFSEWLKLNKSEEEKREKIAKEEREAREKVRDDFNRFVTSLTTNLASTSTRVENITKTLDEVRGQLNSISSVQQEGRILRQQGSGKAR
jgi:hypothetical protein